METNKGETMKEGKGKWQVTYQAKCGAWRVELVHNLVAAGKLKSVLSSLGILATVTLGG